jgi:hypothetical protein
LRVGTVLFSFIRTAGGERMIVISPGKTKKAKGYYSALCVCCPAVFDLAQLVFFYTAHTVERVDVKS